MKIINPNEIGSKISTLISESNEKFYAVTPFLDLSKWRKILINLESAVKRSVEIKIYYREIRDKDFNVLNKLGVKLIKIEGLHTKLYFNESEIIVSSMNLYEFSDLYSIDLALYFNEPDKYIDLHNYFLKYIDSKSEKEEVILNNPTKNKLKTLHNELEKEFPNFKINKASDYLYSKDLGTIFHLFIRLNSITIKYPRKDFTEELINQLEENILKYYQGSLNRNEFDFENDSGYFYWDINIDNNNNNNLEKIKNVVFALYNMKIPDSINKGIIKKNII